MIFVVLGTQKFQFNRLLKEMDYLIEKGSIKDKVYAQVGHSDYVPKNFEYVRFLDKTNFEKAISEADMIVSHSGVGTIISGIKLGKPVLVVPRQEQFKEHIDDHQIEIAESFEKLNYILMCKDETKLGDYITKCKDMKFRAYVSCRDQMLETVKNYLNTLTVGRCE